MKTTAAFQGQVRTSRPIAKAGATVVLAFVLVAAGIAGTGQNRAALSPAGIAPTVVVREADLLEAGLIAESRALIVAPVGSPLTESQALEQRLVSEANALATRQAFRRITVAEVLEQRLLMEAAARR